MIISIRSINFSNLNNNVNTQNKSKRCRNYLNKNQFDTISFSAKSSQLKLSGDSLIMIQKKKKKLQLNKIYKFDNPNVERFQMTSIVSPRNPETRTLLLQYSGYSKDNMTKHIMCAINDSGEIFENNNLVKNENEIKIYEKILPELINYASKELNVK